VRYMLMICDDESVQLGPEEHRAPSRPRRLDRVPGPPRVVLLGGARLRSSGDATTVRARDGEVLISDGPFMETKEQIGGFALIECGDLD
jgi:hypothetical protein